jgi:hypothetical protein
MYFMRGENGAGGLQGEEWPFYIHNSMELFDQVNDSLSVELLLVYMTDIHFVVLRLRLTLFKEKLNNLKSIKFVSFHHVNLS